MLIDRVNGLNEGVAVKPPCRVATTAAITLYGLQTVDTVALLADDRVLVKNQSSLPDNGLYAAAVGAWTRTPDCDGKRDLVNGTRILVNEGTQAGSYIVNGTDPLIPGTSALTIVPSPEGVLAADAIAAAAGAMASAAEAAADVVLTHADVLLTNADAASTATAVSGAQTARDASLYGKGIFPTPAAAIGLGVIGNGAITPGSGGTNGTFALAFTGGTGSGAAGRFVVAGGVLTQILITAPGSYTVVPAFSFAASSGLTGAASTPVLGVNVDVGEYFWTPASTTEMALYQVTAGPVATDTTFRQVADATLGAIARVNLFNLATFTDGQFVNHTTGVLAANAAYWTSDYIPVVAGENYTVSDRNFIAWYNSVHTFISGSNTVSGGVSTITAPATAAYLRGSVQTVNRTPAVYMAVHGNALPASYVGYGKVIDGAAIRDRTVGGAALVDASVTPAKATFIVASKNLFDKATATDGFISAAGGIVTPSGTYSLSGYISVAASTAYHGEGSSSMRTWCFFSDIGVVLAGGSNSSGIDFTTPAGCQYTRVSVTTTDINGFQLEAGSAKTGYVPFGYKFSPDGYGGATGGWLNKTWGALGDSNVAGDAWPAVAAAAVGLAFTDFGIGGTWVSGASNSTTAMFSDTRINAMPTTLDIATVMGGTNDWFNNVALGAATSVTSTEYNGALNLMCQKMIDRWLTKTVMLVTPPWTETLTANLAAKGWSNEWTNTQSLTPADYADAVRAAGRRYNLPVIDLQAEEGVNHRNIASRRVNDGNYLHFDLTVSAPRVAAIYAAGFKRQTPAA